jgi:hypothetical protein
LLSRLKSNASAIAPSEEHIHPIKLMAPYPASVAGRRNIPDPIMFPTTKAVLVHNPILEEEFVVVIRTQY